MIFTEYYLDRARTRDDLPRWLFADPQNASLASDLPSASINTPARPSARGTAIPRSNTDDFDIFASRKAASSAPPLSASYTPSASSGTLSSLAQQPNRASTPSAGPPQSAAAARLKAMREAQKAGAVAR